MRLKTVLGATGVIVAVSWSAVGALAQASSPQFPADIRVGDCVSLGEVVAPLAPLVVPEGDPQGQAGATPVHQSVTEVPLLLEDILSASYSVAVHASSEQVGTPIACGAIGGTLAADGSLSVGLQAMNGAKLSGVAAFMPTATGDGTSVSVLLVDERGGRERTDAVEDDGDDDVVGGHEVVDGADAADGVGNVTVGPAPDQARNADGTNPSNATDSPAGQPGPSNQPGEDGAVDRPRGGSDGARAGDGNRDRGGTGNDGGAARAGEDGSSN